MPLSFNQYHFMVIKRLIINNLFTAVLQLGGLALTTLGSRFSFIWFAPGVALALIFLKGQRILPGIFLGSFLAYFLAKIGIILAILLALLQCIQAFLLLWLAERNGYPIPFLYQPKFFIKFIFYMIITTGICSFVMLTLCYPFLYHPILSAEALFLNWWLANLNGTLIFYLIFISCDTYFPQSDLISQKKKLIFVFHCLFLLSIILQLTITQSSIIIISLINLILLYILIVFSTFRQFGLITALFITDFCLSLSTFANAPLWQTKFAIETLFYLQFILTLFTLYSVFLSLQMVKTEFNDLT